MWEQKLDHTNKTTPRARRALYLTLTIPILLLLVRTNTTHDPFRQCDRQCRYAHGFYDRTVTGQRTRKGCSCFRGPEPLGNSTQPFVSQKPWNESFWCGDFETDLVCALDSSASTHTLSLSEARRQAFEVLHCGACAACSSLHDLGVLNSTREYVTEAVTRCATAFAKPRWLGGHQSFEKLAECLRTSSVDFGEVRPANNRSSCMDCWTDNVACDAVQCRSNLACIWKFFDPSNPGSLRGCLACDEKHCGPEFIRCAGANRRSSGIVSDIHRPSDQVCPVGFFSGS